MLGAVTHKDDGRAIPVVFRRIGDKGVGKIFVIVVGGEKRRADHKMIKLILVLVDGGDHIVVFIAAHNVGRLHHEGLDVVLDKALERLLDVVNFQSVPLLELVDDDLAGEGSAHLEFGKFLLDCLFDRADGLFPAVVVAGAEAHNQNHGLGFLFLGLLFRVAAGDGKQRTQHGCGKKDGQNFFDFHVGFFLSVFLLFSCGLF